MTQCQRYGSLSISLVRFWNYGVTALKDIAISRYYNVSIEQLLCSEWKQYYRVTWTCTLSTKTSIIFIVHWRSSSLSWIISMLWTTPCRGNYLACVIPLLILLLNSLCCVDPSFLPLTLPNPVPPGYDAMAMFWRTLGESASLISHSDGKKETIHNISGASGCGQHTIIMHTDRARLCWYQPCLGLARLAEDLRTRRFRKVSVIFSVCVFSLNCYNILYWVITCSLLYHGFYTRAATWCFWMEPVVRESLRCLCHHWLKTSTRPRASDRLVDIFFVSLKLHWCNWISIRFTTLNSS